MAAQFVTDSLAWLGLSQAVDGRTLHRIQSQPHMQTPGSASSPPAHLRQTTDGVPRASLQTLKTSLSATALSTSCPLLTSRREKPVVCDEDATSETPPETVNIFKEYALSKHKVLRDALESAVIAPEDSPANTLVEGMRYALLGDGKRIRPILALAACEMFGGSDEQCLPTAVAIEMIHAMSLVHDDLPVMDNDDLRRGRPTTHKVFGESVAVLVGDALLAEAFGIIAGRTAGVPPTVVLQVISRISAAAGHDGLAGGQVRDLECEKMSKSVVFLEDLQWIHIRKTAVFLQAAITCGALIGGATQEDVCRLEKFANYVGLAYQVIDDILDVTSSTEVLGKTAGKDVAADKATYPSLIGLDESGNLARKLIEEAKDVLKPYGDRARVLLSIADYILSRRK